jgi:hypothetical protein
MQTPLGSLLSNPRNKRVRYFHPAKCFMLTVEVDSNGKRKKEKKLCGITRIMGKYFWPDYEYKRDRYNLGTGAHSKEDGIERGVTVHRQLRDYANLSAKDFKKKHPLEDIHDYTRYAIKTLKLWKLKPVCAEFIIYDEDNGIATAIDMICTPTASKGGEIILLDWKCGFDHYMVKSNNADMKGPLKEYSCCPLYQGYYQLAIESAILSTKYGITPSKCIVVQLSQEQVNPYIVPTEVLNASVELYDFMVASRMEEKNEKERNKKRKKNKSTNVHV